tara:strand:- start:9 stop:752 length:744 start_codon:yes stop_codon:yes gene_type:complete
MNKLKNLIFELNHLKKSYQDQTAINISRLEFHRGTIYGIVGPIGSGKSTLLKMLGGKFKQSSGSLKYENFPFKLNLFGSVQPHSEIKLVQLNDKISRSAISELFKKPSSKSILSKFFKNRVNIINTSLNYKELSNGELALLNLLYAFDHDPRALLVDDYCSLFDNMLEKKIRERIKLMNRDLGTTFILTSSSDTNLKKLASVLIYLDNGHISKIRSGLLRKPSKQIRSKKKNYSKHRTKKPKYRSKV